MKARAYSNFITLSKPIFPGVQEKLFEEVKKSYSVNVLKMVTEVAQHQVEDVLILINHMLTELGTTMGRQRRDYGLDLEQFPPEFPIKDQASIIDDTPTNNMDMERLMG